MGEVINLKEWRERKEMERLSKRVGEMIAQLGQEDWKVFDSILFPDIDDLSSAERLYQPALDLSMPSIERTVSLYNAPTAEYDLNMSRAHSSIWLERPTHNRQVPGSSPGGPTTSSTRSSTGQSTGLLSRGLQVRVLPGVPLGGSVQPRDRATPIPAHLPRTKNKE